MLVDAFPAAGGDVAELALREMEVDRQTLVVLSAGSLGEAQQRLGNPRLEVPKQHVLDLLGRLPQPLAQDPEQDHAHVGVVFEDRDKISAAQYQELAIGHGNRVRRPLSAVEQSELAKYFAGVHDVQDKFFPLGGNRG